MGVVHVGAGAVGLVHGVAHPQLVPPDFVHAVVVAATGRVGSLVEFWMEKYGSGGFLSAGRAAEDAYAVDVHVGILLGGGLDPGDMVGQAGILQVLVAYFFELFGAEGGSHAVHLYHDEAQFGQRGHPPVVGSKGFGYVLVARAGVDVLDNGVFLVRVEIGGAVDESPHVGLSIAPFGREHLGGLPAVL